MARTLVVLTALLYVSCSRNQAPPVTGFYNIDSLITAQVKLLYDGGHELSKKAAIGDQSTSVVIKPDSASWASELAVFRQLEVAGRPNNRDRYRISDVSDPNSNLRIRSFEAKDTPVPVIRFFYLDGPTDVRRIESRYSESNALYKSTRELIMVFEHNGNLSTLHHYTIDGYQKLLMSDSVHFSVEGDIL